MKRCCVTRRYSTLPRSAFPIGITDRTSWRASIVRDGHRCTEQELRDFCSRELGRYKTPKVIRFVNDLPRGPSGKVQRLKACRTRA